MLLVFSEANIRKKYVFLYVRVFEYVRNPKVKDTNIRWHAKRKILFKFLMASFFVPEGALPVAAPCLTPLGALRTGESISVQQSARTFTLRQPNLLTQLNDEYACSMKL